MLESLAKTKNLLAFSSGVDSTALFFMLLENNIPFDITIVDYEIREQSKEEVEYSQYLANKYNKKCHFTTSPQFEKGSFEKQARDFRYEYFENLIEKYNYETLITAHQLDDMLEWFMMQLSKGAGLSELLGMQPITQKENYKLVRPILDKTKKELLEYLNEKDIKYFVDETNTDTKYKRNEFREKYTKELLENYSLGIKKSFSYLQEDAKTFNETPILYKEKSLTIARLTGEKNIDLRRIDKLLKQYGHLISSDTREEIWKQKSIVISHSTCVEIQNNILYISPFVEENMTKEFKEECRIKKIPNKIRAYLFRENINLTSEHLK